MYSYLYMRMYVSTCVFAGWEMRKGLEEGGGELEEGGDRVMELVSGE